MGGSFSNMESTIKQLDGSRADYIHFDVMDGDFVPNLTFGPQFISDLRSKTKKMQIHDFLNFIIKKGIKVNSANISGKYMEIDTFNDLKLAKKINGEIINADSMQVYKEIKILSARPYQNDYKKIRHHL